MSHSKPSRRPTAPQPRGRRALTLVEVLIAIGVLAVGLLGVASIFPVGGYYMQSGDVADRGAAIAQAALEDAVVRGYLDPESWVGHQINDNATTPGTTFRTISTANTSAFMRMTSGVAELFNTGQTVRFVGMSQADGVSPGAVLGASKPTPGEYHATLFGGAYVIDPLGIASTLFRSPQAVVINPLTSTPVRRYPAFGGVSAFTAPQWGPWHANGAFWPVRRLTTVHEPYRLNSAPIAASQQVFYPQHLGIAQELLTAADDLATTLPANGDDPAQGLWEQARLAAGSAWAPVARQSRRDYSWIVSIAPDSTATRDAFGNRPDAGAVEVSAAVFHKRTQARDAETAVENERLVNARLVTTAPGACELLLEPRGGAGVAEPTTSPFEDLREGQYVTLVGPHPLSTPAAPRLVLKWLRVLKVEDSGTPVLPDVDMPATARRLSRDGATPRVLVALRGPDVPWRPATISGRPDLEDRQLLANDLRLAIVPGVVAVHTKTMRLEAASVWAID